VNGRQFLSARRLCLAVSLAASLGLLFAAPAAAQGYPSRPVKIIMPFAPGGPTEFIIRLVADRLTATLGQAFVIENRPEKLNGAVNEILKSKDTQAGLARLSAEAKIGSPQDFTAFIGAEAPRWAAIANETGIKVD
jgi:tripartite-type tricarboxylate transporter receptor subunit TctC